MEIVDHFSMIVNAHLKILESMGLSSPSGSPSPSYKLQNTDEDTAGSFVQKLSLFLP